jgi:hypothetical protein
MLRSSDQVVGRVQRTRRRRFVDEGFDRLALMNPGPDVEGFFRFHESELSDAVRELDRRSATTRRS